VDGLPFGVGGVEVFHRGGVGDPEHAHAADRVGGVADLVEDPVGPELRGAHARRSKAPVDHRQGDGRVGGVDGGLLADQQVGIGGIGPAPLALTQPGDDEAVGDLAQVDDVAAHATADGEPAAGQVEVGQ
jgi:hypothetical protein